MTLLSQRYSPAMWDPFRELDRLHSELNQLFEGYAPAGAAELPVNLWASEADVRVTAELPGVEPDAVHLTVKDQTLLIEGERKAPELGEKARWLRQERPTGRFVRHLQLPYEVEADKIEARYRNGILEVTLPRKESSKPRRIAIQSAS